MTPGGERHAKDRVAWGKQRQHYRLVGLCPGMRLDIGKVAAEQPFGALDRQAFGDIDKGAAAVIAAAGIALGIFIGEQRTLRFEHRPRDDVLAGDQLDLRLFALALALDRRGQLRIGGGQVVGKEAAVSLGGRREGG